MAYDIPPPLQHKEKIIFDLTFEQLGYAATGLLTAVFLFKYLPLNTVGKSIGALIPCVIATFFVYFDLKKYLVNLLVFLKFKKTGLNSHKVKKLIGVKKIEDNVILTEKGKVAVLEVSPINFMIRTEEEKERINISFQKFLNSLDFPIQIHISSCAVNLSNHFREVRKKSKKTHSELVTDYCSFLTGLMKEGHVINKRFLLVIHEKNDLEQQVNLIQERLKSLGLKSKRLRTGQILRFLDFYINKGVKRSSTEGDIEVLKLLSPALVDEDMDCMRINDRYYKILSVKGYPSTVENGFLDRIISLGEFFDISMHIQPSSISETMIALNSDLQKQQGDLYAESKKGILNQTLEIKFKSTKKVLNDLYKGQEKLYNISLSVMCYSQSLKKIKIRLTDEEKKRLKNEKDEKLQERLLDLIEKKRIKKAKKEVDLLLKKVKAELDAIMIDSKPSYVQMRDAYKSMLPLGVDSLNEKRNITSSGLAALFPFSSTFLVCEKNGVLLGLTKNTTPYIRDVFKLHNANGLVLATSGGGKSYFTKLFLSRQFLSGVDALIIDPQSEYLGITERYGGEIVTISKDSETIINPLDLMGQDYEDKRLSLMALFPLMLGELSDVQKAVLDRAVELAYDRKGIRKNSFKGKIPPKLEDVQAALKELSREAKGVEGMPYHALLNRLSLYVGSGVFSFLNRDTIIDFNNKFVCFNIGSMPKEVKPVVMYLILEFLFHRMKGSLKRKVLVIDEAWSFLQVPELSKHVFEMVKTCRHHHLGLVLITQDVEDLMGSKAGTAVLANTSYTFLLRQKPAVMRQVMNYFDLSQYEREFLVSAQKGRGILILGNDHQELQVVASPEEHKLITTNPEDKIKKPEKKVSGKKVEVGLDLKNCVYPAKGLSIEEKNFLANNGFKLLQLVDIGKTRSELFYVKESPPEGHEHTFLVERAKTLLTEKGLAVERHLTVKPDLTFASKQGEHFALEIETGVGHEKHRDRLDEKYNRLCEEYGDNLNVLITNAKKKYIFESYGIKVWTRKDFNEFLSLFS